MADGNGLGGVVKPWNLRADRAQDFVWNGIGPRGDIGGRDFCMSLPPDEHDFVAHCRMRDRSDIHHHHVHTD